MTWKGILEDVVTRHTIYVASNKDVWNPRPSTKTQGLSRDQAQKLCPPYIIDSTCLLSTKVEIEYRGRGDRQKARLNIHPCPDPKLSLGDLGPNSNPLVVWDLQNVEAEVTSAMRENLAQCARCRDIREATFRTTENSAIQCMIAYMG